MLGGGGTPRGTDASVVIVPAWSVALALAMSPVVGLGFSIYPAPRLDPVEAMRTE